MTNETVRPSEPFSQPASVTAVVLLLASLTIMANATIAPSLPGLSAAFSATPGIEDLTGLALSLPSLSIVVTAAVFGVLADKVDRRVLLVALVLLYALAGASGAFINSISTLMAGRIFLGIAVSGVMTLVTMMAGEFWRGPPRERFMGLQAAATSAGGVVFLILGGVLAEVSWRAPFLIYLLALPLAPLVWIILSKPLSERVESGSHETTHRRMPIQPVLEVSALAFFIMVAFYLIPTRLPFLIKDLGYEAPSLSGFAISSMTAASVPASLLYAKARARIQPLILFAVSFALMASGFFLISLASQIAMIFGGCILTGAGLGIAMPNQVSWLMARVPDTVRGRASGLLTMAIFGGQFCSPIAASLLSEHTDLAGTFRSFSAALISVATPMIILSLRRQQNANPASERTVQ